MVSESLDSSFIAFSEAFPDNESCIKHLAKQRWPDGFICPRCACRQAWILKKRALYDCKACRHQTSITSDTIFHKTHLPLHKWYWLIYHMVVHKQDFSVSELKRRLAIKSYKTAWLMAHKIRKALEERDERFRLEGLVKINLSYFRSEVMRHRRRQEGENILLCAVAYYRNYKGAQEPGFAYMTIVNDVKMDTIKDFMGTIDRGQKSTWGKQLLERIQSESWQSYLQQDDRQSLSQCEVAFLNPKAAEVLIPWIDQMIQDAKDVILRTHRGISDKYLHSYLSEIISRFNHQHWEHELFDRLIQSCLKVNIVTYKNLVHPNNR